MKTPDSTTTLLDYAINTTPDPLQASPPGGNTVYAALILVVSNSSNAAVSLESIQVTIPPDLTDHLESILYNADPQRVWSITPASPGVFNILPVSGKPVTITTEGVVFQFFNIAVSPVVGTVQIGIIETASSSVAGLDDRFLNIPVTKFPYGFFFSNFTPQIPLVQDNQTVTLTWEGSSQAKYVLYYNNEVVDVTNVRKWTTKPITNDVTFLLRAVLVSLGETVIKDLTTTVIVATPQIQADTLQVSGNTQLLGNVNLGANSSSQLNVTGDAVISGNAQLSGNANLGSDSSSRLNVKGDTAISGRLNANSINIAADGQINNLNVENILTVDYLAKLRLIDADTVNTNALKVTQSFITNMVCVGLWFIIMDNQGNLAFQYLAETIVSFSSNGKITVTPFNPSDSTETTAGTKKD